MFNLFTPFNREFSESRANRVAHLIIMPCQQDRIPNRENLESLVVQFMVDYVEEIARCGGQESREALRTLEDVHSVLFAFETAGILKDCAIDCFDRDMQEFLFDELRRCGIGKYRGYFEPVED